MKFNLTNSEIKQLIEAGAKAPSGGNAQAWLVNAYYNGFKIYVDPERSRTFLDVGRFASYLSLGSFLENLLLKADIMGLEFTVSLNQEREKIGPVINLILNNRYTQKLEKNDHLGNYIGKRTTNRKMYNGEIIGVYLINKLKKSLDIKINNKKQKNIVSFHSIYREEEKKHLADILGKADRIRTVNDTLFKQLMKELRFSKDEIQSTRDGIDVNTMEFPGNIIKMIKLMSEHPNLRKVIPKTAFEQQAKPLLKGSSHLCCLSLEKPVTPEKMIDAGQILERVWLEATRLGLALQPWTVVTFFILRVNDFKGDGFNAGEIAEFKQIDQNIRAIFRINKNKAPLFIFRLSRAKPPSALALRRNYLDFTSVKDELL